MTTPDSPRERLARLLIGPEEMSKHVDVAAVQWKYAHARADSILDAGWLSPETTEQWRREMGDVLAIHEDKRMKAEAALAALQEKIRNAPTVAWLTGHTNEWVTKTLGLPAGTELIQRIDLPTEQT